MEIRHFPSALLTFELKFKIKDPTPMFPNVTGLLAHAEVLEAAGFHVFFLVDVSKVEEVGLVQQFLYPV